MTFEEIEKELLNTVGLLKFDGIIIKSKTLEEFLSWELFHLIDEYETVFANTNTHQCKANRYRSGGDLFLICKYYFPESTFEGIRKTVQNMDVYNGWFCPDIQKQVYFHINKPNHDMQYFHTSQRGNRWRPQDEWGIEVKPYSLKIELEKQKAVEEVNI